MIFSMKKYFKASEKKVKKDMFQSTYDESNFDVKFNVNYIEIDLNEIEKNNLLKKTSLFLTFKKEENEHSKKIDTDIILNGSMELFPNEKNVMYCNETGFKEGFYCEDFYEDIHSVFLSQFKKELKKDYIVDLKVFFYSTGLCINGKLTKI